MDNDVFNKMVADKISNHIELDKQGNTLNEIVYKCVYSALNIKDEVYYNDKVNDLKSELETFFTNSANNYMKYNEELRAKGERLHNGFCNMIEDRSKMVRAKAVKDGVWVYGEVVTRSDGKVFVNQVSKDLFVDNESDNELDNNGIQSGEFNFVEVDKDTLCMFMGFYDRNIQPIYENDIVSRYGTDCNKCLSAMGFNEEERKRYFYHCPIVDKIKECPQYEVMRDVVSGKRFRYWLENECFGYEGEKLVDNFEFKKCEDDVERWVVRDCKVIGNTFDDKYVNFYIGD